MTLSTSITQHGRRLGLATLLGLGLASAAPALAANGDDDAKLLGGIAERICRHQFELAQRTDMESFRDYDADTFRAIHTDDTLSIFTSGATLIGIDAVMNALASHFANREAQWSWSEITRSVEGCRTAYILYETRYSIPRIGLSIRARTGVTYTWERGLWLVVADQGTLLP
jgi:hypothetical protein